MRILQVINTLKTAGAEILVVETSKRFIKKGHQVDILLLAGYECPLLREMKDHPDITLLTLGETNNIYSPLNIFRIGRIIKENEYDIVHAHLFPSFYWIGLAKKHFLPARLVYTEHNTKNRRMGNAMYRWVDNLIYPKFDCHIAISETVRTNLDAHIQTKKNKIVTIYNGIDLERIKDAKPISKTSLGVPEHAKLLLQVSAFRLQKNQETLIKALALMGSDVHLAFAGEGERKELNENLAKTLGLEDRVHFLGVRKDVPQLLKTADIVVLSTHYEGLSLSSVEGLASGKPFVASDVPGLSEVVEGAGILFPDNDHETLAEEIQKLLSNMTHYQKVTKQCLERSGRYNIENMVDSYLELYNDLISE